MKKGLVAMSGGVDSSVAALLLQKQGYDIAGITMCLGIKDAAHGKTRCCGVEAINDARQVCQKLGIDHFVLDYAQELEKQVIGRFMDGYQKGITPNPCIDCNRYLKFGSLLLKAKVMGFDFLATGHYAAIRMKENNLRLMKPRDDKKDQTYFLYGIKKVDLESIEFPLADLTKPEVRKLAVEAGLPVAQKAESQDICFVSEKNPGDFLANQGVKGSPGAIVTKEGRVLGKHKGICYYTVGQRAGLGISHPVPLYVCKIDAMKNQIIIGEKNDLKVKGLVAEDLNVLVWPWPENVRAKIRYRKQEVDCSISRKEESLVVTFKNEQEGVAPGQAVVFYENDVVLGGGQIKETF